MKLRKIVFAWILAIFALFATYVCATEYDISELNISNITLPDSYFSCSRTQCDSGFSRILSANGHTHASWTENVMIPQNLYLCGRDGNGNVINVTISDPSTEQDKKDNIKYHRLMYDYNLYSSAPKTREKALIKYRDSLVNAGVNKRRIMRIKWIEIYELSDDTPYILGIYKTEDGAFVYDWCTIYDGNVLSTAFTFKSEPDDLTEMTQVIKNISFEKTIDYSQAKQVYRQNQRVKLPEKLSTKQKRSKMFVATGLSFISVVILTGIAITTAKIRKRTKSSRNSRSGRY